jgi:hypothetical protein
VVPVPLATVAVFPASPHVTVDLFLTVHPQTTAFVHTRNRTEAPLLEFLWVQVSNSQMNEGSEAPKNHIFHHDLPRSSGCTSITKGLRLLCFLIGGHMYTRFDLSNLHLIVDLK